MQEPSTKPAALKAAKCERIYREQASGGRWDRPELQRLLDQLRKGDVLVVWKLDRLSRSLRDVLTIMERLAEAKTGFRSLTAHTAVSADPEPADIDSAAWCGASLPAPSEQLRLRALC